MNRDFEAVDTLAHLLATVSTERLSLESCNGLVGREAVIADRDSPAIDVSAMDGYGLLFSDVIAGRELRVDARSTPGHPAPASPSSGTAIQIFTGAPVPDGCDLVIRREDVSELATSNTPDVITSIRIGDREHRIGENIRRQGENGRKDDEVLAPGHLLQPGSIAAAANFGAASLTVSKRVRVRLIITGDELRSVRDRVQPWELRDSNGATLAAILGSHRWIEVCCFERAGDDLEKLGAMIADASSDADAVILTGGVSQGDFDFVPAAIRRSGGEIIFHRLPIRPGKPICGGVGSQGQLILGLPGNPVSVAVGCVRFAIPWLRKMAGFATWNRMPPNVELAEPPQRTLPLHWFPLVRIKDSGKAELVPSKGSGDLVSMAHSDGFVGIPPESTGVGPWPFWSWNA